MNIYTDYTEIKDKVIMTIENLIDYLEKYPWTQISFSPEICNKEELDVFWEPKQGWCQIIYKNLDKDNKQIAIVKDMNKEEYLSLVSFSNTEKVFNLIKEFIEMYYNVKVTNISLLVVDLIFVSHDLLFALNNIL